MSDGSRLDANQFRERFAPNTNEVALSAVFAAATAIATMFITVPISQGYLNFGEVIIYTAAFLFGGVVGGLAGGVGAAAADVMLGFPVWAPITFVGKGIEGFVVGEVSGESTRSKVIAVLLGAPFMIGAYVIASFFFYGTPAAIAELGMDVVQAGVGALVALPLSELLKSRIPQLS